MDTFETNIRLARFCGFEVDEHGNIISHTKTRTIVWKNDILPRYTDDRTAIALVEAELQAQGLHEQYAVALARLVGYDKTPAGAFRLITATPAQRAEAALAVIGEGETA